MNDYPERRDLDGVYFRVERDGRFLSLCFTDMTEEEREKVIEGRPAEWLASLALIMANALRRVGDELDIRMVDCDGDR